MTAAIGLSTYQWNNNIKSLLLLAAFPFLLLLLVGGIFFVAGLVYVQPDGVVQPQLLQGLGLETARLSPLQLAQEGIIAYWPIVFGIAAVWMVLGYLFNGAMIRAATGAHKVERAEAPELYNLLENMCISRGMKMPELYIMESEQLNAFASGINESNYSITVTRGILQRLDKDELEAVLGHELTHILNRDVRLLIVTVVFTGMISFIAQMLWRSMRYSGRSRDRKGGGTGALMLIAAVMFAVGYLLAQLLRFAISRRREYLADAGSVELTKNPDAMIRALQKISGNAAMPGVPSEVQQMFIENPPSVFSLFATHPPIEDRIRVLRELGGLPEQGHSIIPKVG